MFYLGRLNRPNRKQILLKVMLGKPEKTSVEKYGKVIIMVVVFVGFKNEYLENSIFLKGRCAIIRETEFLKKYARIMTAKRSFF